MALCPQDSTVLLCLLQEQKEMVTLSFPDIIKGLVAWTHMME